MTSQYGEYSDYKRANTCFADTGSGVKVKNKPIQRTEWRARLAILQK